MSIRCCLYCGDDISALRAGSNVCRARECQLKNQSTLTKESKLKSAELDKLERAHYAHNYPDFYEIARPIVWGVRAKKRQCLKCGNVGEFSNGQRLCPTCHRSNARVGRLAQ